MERIIRGNLTLGRSQQTQPNQAFGAQIGRTSVDANKQWADYRIEENFMRNVRFGGQSQAFNFSVGAQTMNINQMEDPIMRRVGRIEGTTMKGIIGEQPKLLSASTRAAQTTKNVNQGEDMRRLKSKKASQTKYRKSTTRIFELEESTKQLEKKVDAYERQSLKEKEKYSKLQKKYNNLLQYAKTQEAEGKRQKEQLDNLMAEKEEYQQAKRRKPLEMTIDEISRMEQEVSYQQGENEVEDSWNILNELLLPKEQQQKEPEDGAATEVPNDVSSVEKQVVPNENEMIEQEMEESSSMYMFDDLFGPNFEFIPIRTLESEEEQEQEQEEQEHDQEEEGEEKEEEHEQEEEGQVIQKYENERKENENLERELEKLEYEQEENFRRVNEEITNENEEGEVVLIDALPMFLKPKFTPYGIEIDYTW